MRDNHSTEALYGVKATSRTHPLKITAAKTPHPGRVANILAKITRIVTLAPVMCLILLTILFAYRREIIFPTASGFFLAILFLVVFPLMSYPIHAAIPRLRATGRKGQRIFAIIMANLGYLAGIVVTLFLHQTPQLQFIYLTYLFSGAIIAILSFIIKFKASAHFCGVTGPIAMLTYLLGPIALIGLVLLPALVWSTLRLKRHTVPQMLVGSVVPLAAMGIAWLCIFL